jgi:hypothetical protein
MEANRRLGSPMDGLLQVARTDGIVLAENDDVHGRDPQIVFQAPAAGTYVVRTFAFPATPDSKIGFSGGETFLYRLTLTTRGFIDHPYPLAVTRGKTLEVLAEGWNIGDDARMLRVEPLDGTLAVASHPKLGNIAEVRLRLAADRFALVPGKPLSLPVTVERTNGFDQAVELAAVGLPECVSVRPAKSEAKGETAKAVTLTIETKPGDPAWSGPFQIVGRIQGDPGRERTAEAKVDALEATTRQVWLTVGKAADAKAAETPARKKN